MPIFARKKLVIEDYCLTAAAGTPAYTTPEILLSYEGPNPHKAYFQAKKVLSTVFGVPEEKIQERDFSWDKSQPEENFQTKFVLVKEVDRFSFMYVEVSLKGKFRQSQNFEKEGSIEIKISSSLKTEYPQDTVWERSIFYEMLRVAYHKLFYQDKRQKYLEECKRLTLMFYDSMKQFLDLLPKPSK